MRNMAAPNKAFGSSTVERYPASRTKPPQVYSAPPATFRRLVSLGSRVKLTDWPYKA